MEVLHHADTTFIVGRHDEEITFIYYYQSDLAL